ncbi:Vomeronasal type-1 receptor 3 [Tupaia chinensis]|uniref:Vomeronasal type-1 receptor n=1 Tax=Tupaia chinensis TaxID=246437 RepID=L9KS47_TUPCH|nr:Vomeronasal type-1 receptor 3 [Tupaia chinensis]
MEISMAEKSQMVPSDMATGMIFLSQTVIGLLGNFFLLYHYSVLYFTRGTLRYTDLMVKHLTVANILIFLSRGILQTISAFGLNYFLSNIGCQLIFYVHRVGRGMSLGSTCLLSIFQAFTISPRNSRCTELKVHTSQYVGLSHSLILCWVVNMLVNSVVPMYVTGNDFLYCSWVDNNRVPQLLVIILLSSYDILCLGLMIWACSSTVFILYRHRQRVQHIHRTNLSSRSSPESRVTESILVLLSTFISFYTLSYVFTFIHCSFLLSNEKDPEPPDALSWKMKSSHLAGSSLSGKPHSSALSPSQDLFLFLSGSDTAPWIVVTNDRGCRVMYPVDQILPSSSSVIDQFLDLLSLFVCSTQTGQLTCVCGAGLHLVSTKAL